MSWGAVWALGGRSLLPLRRKSYRHKSLGTKMAYILPDHEAVIETLGAVTVGKLRKIPVLLGPSENRFLQ